MTPAAKPILWHIAISHYNEKVRWALAYKGVDHERREPHPLRRILSSFAGKRKRHYPVMRIDGETIGDSTAIIAALERRYPDPPLYPAAADERERALALEEFFDEEVGPGVRVLSLYELSREPERIVDVVSEFIPVRSLARLSAGVFWKLRFGSLTDAQGEAARVTVLAALDRLEAELGDNEYLVGNAFSVADLTAASILYPLVLPPEGPQVVTDVPEDSARFRAPLRARRGYQWVEEMFRRHREPDARPAAAESPGQR
jgi:glutathione S-transferase